MDAQSRHQKWVAGLSEERREEMLERKRVNERKSRKKEKESRPPDDAAGLLLFNKLCVQARAEPRLAVLLKRYKYISIGRWAAAREACDGHRKSGEARGKKWNALTKKLRKEWLKLSKCHGFSVFLLHTRKLLAVEKTKNGEDLTVEDVADVQKRCDVASVILETCKKELLVSCRQLRAQIDISAVYHPSWVKQESEKIHRAVCRIRYHRAKMGTPDAVPLLTIYPGLYQEFMRVAETAPESESVRERTEQVNLVVWRLCDQVEKMLAAETAAAAATAAEEEWEWSGAVGSQDEPDANNVGLEEMGEEHEVGEDGVVEVPDDDVGVDEAVQLREEAEQILIQEPDLREGAGELGAFYAPRVIYAVPCTCRPWTPAQACTLKATLTSLLDSIECEQYAPLFDFEKKGLDALRAGKVCYTGLRTIDARLSTIRSLVDLIKIVKESFGQTESLIDGAILSRMWTWLPKAVRIVVEAEFADDENAKRLSEAAIKAAHRRSMKKMAEKVADTEKQFCDVCNRARIDSEMRNHTSFQMERFMRADVRRIRAADPDKWVNICKGCMSEATAGKRSLAERQRNPLLPKYSENNVMGFEEVPNALRGLNWIEQALVQLVRPIRSIMCLNDVGGHRTPMRSVGGAMVLLPVPTEGTMQHVTQTLPSDAGLTILVSPEAAKGKLVRLPAVLRALQWLVAENPHYKDITINQSFRFSRESVIFTGRKKDARPVSDQELENLVSDQEEPPSLLRHEDVAAQIIRPMHGGGAPGLAHEQYALLKNPYEPMSVDTTFLETKCFPWLFPRGKFCVHSPREKKVSLREMVKWWMACKDRRVAQDPQVLSFLHGLLEQIDMTSALGIQARLNRGQLHGETFLNAVTEGSADFEGSFHSAARVMRGHAAYFDLKKKELRSHIALFGTPTWFLTLNPAERRWEEVGDLYRSVYGNQVNRSNLFEYIAKDPYFFARCFQQRLRAVLFTLLLNSEGDKAGGPLGKVIHYFIRVEYQHRGTQHVHCVIWTEGAPDESATDAERLAFIDRYVTARVPDEATEPELYELVKNEQMHYEKHSNTCNRDFKVKGKKRTRCRFDFPRPCTPMTIVNKAWERLQALPGTRIKKYYVKRRKCDMFVNDYNPAITLSWKSNTDLQFIWSGCSEVVNYITGYVTKNEKSKDVLDSNQVLKEATSSKQAFCALVDLMHKRQCGYLEVVDTLVGHPFCFFDTGHVTLNSNASNKRDRMLRPKGVIEKEVAEGVDAAAFKDNVADVYYPGRSEALEDFCLYNIVSRFRAASRKNASSVGDERDGGGEDVLVGAPATANSRSLDPFEPHFKVHNRHSPMYDHERDTNTLHPISGCRQEKVHVLLGRPLVPRLFWPNLEASNDESREDFYRRLCFMFIPWRSEEEIKGNAESYEARWNAFVEEMTVLDPDALADIKHIIEYQDAQLAQDREVTERRKVQRDLLKAMVVDEDAEGDGPLVFDRDVDVATHETAVAAMNAGQRALFDEIVAHVAAQDEHARADKAIVDDESLTPLERADARAHLGPRPAAMLRVVVGTAGCGKSYLINALADKLTLDYTTPERRASAPAVLLAAPTGLAAVQIRGSTLHSLLGIEVQHGRDAAMRPLSAMHLNELRLKFRNARLLIVDELSMISGIVLMKMHMRLGAIKENRCKMLITQVPELFGGLNILLLGDLMQLPPVAAPAIFAQLTSRTINRVFGAMLSDMCLFDAFDYVELTTNMRQQGDVAFGELLSRLRVQALTDDDVKLLETRIIQRNPGEKPMDAAARKLVELMAATSTPPMALFSTNEEVRKFNTTVVDLLQLNSCVVEAEDSEPRRKEGAGRGGASSSRPDGRPKARRIYQDTPYDVRKAPSSGGVSGKKKRKTAGVQDGEEDDAVEQQARVLTEDDANRAAGLEKHLLLAENGRIMLRRNLDAAKGLVNGACGVLQKILKTPDGDVYALSIVFDGCKESTLIEKESATFDLNDEEQQTRRQFPVAMAFGATVHKAQGMTLSSAIVSTAKFFGSAPAQGFVALSRVRTLDTLFLVDLHPEKLLCSRKALQKYNELRATVDLPPFADPIVRRAARGAQREEEVEDAAAAAGEPPRTPREVPPTPSSRQPSSARLRMPSYAVDESADSTPRPTRRRPTSDRRQPDVEMGEEEETERSPARKRPVDPSSSSNSRGGLPEIVCSPHLRLRNDNKLDCYIISALNLIHTVKELRYGMLDSAPVLEGAGQLTAKMKEVIAVLEGKRSNVVALRAAADLPEELGAATDFLQSTMDDFSEVFDRHVKTTLSVDLICRNGHRTANAGYSGTIYRHILSAGALPPGYTRGTLDDIYHVNQKHNAFCRQCMAPIDKADVRVAPAGSLIIVQIDRVSVDESGSRFERELHLEGINAVRMKFLGMPVSIVACIQHIPWEDGDNGHFVVWRRESNGWSVVDDDRAFTTNQLPVKSKNIHIFVLKKL